MKQEQETQPAEPKPRAHAPKWLFVAFLSVIALLLIVLAIFVASSFQL
ncbi:hypothetical protein IH979_02160 [Patescibacteria group bacterium]|nr:hypothetical protein [Patescibacteria group bacterium]